MRILWQILFSLMLRLVDGQQQLVDRAGEVQIPGQVIGGEAVPTGGMEGGDWRTQLQQDSRQRIVNKIMETLKRCLPFPGHEELQELKKKAIRYEEKIYSEATSQSDYLRKISLKMLAMETKYANPMANSLQSNAASTNKNPQDTASLDSSSQIGRAADEDWQEGSYQKIKSMHEMYYSELNEMYQRWLPNCSSTMLFLDSLGMSHLIN